MGLFENVNSEPVRNLNLRTPVVVKPTDTVRQVVASMRDENLGCAIVVDETNRPTGMFTESMVTQIVASRPDALDALISAEAADHWPQVKLDDPISSVVDALELKNIRFLSVVDAKGCVVGITGQKGLMEYVAEHFPGQVLVHRTGQESFMQNREGA